MNNYTRGQLRDNENINDWDEITLKNFVGEMNKKRKYSTQKWIFV